MYTVLFSSNNTEIIPNLWKVFSYFSVSFVVIFIIYIHQHIPSSLNTHQVSSSECWIPFTFPLNMTVSTQNNNKFSSASTAGALPKPCFQLPLCCWKWTLRLVQYRNTPVTSERTDWAHGILEKRQKLWDTFTTVSQIS